MKYKAADAPITFEELVMVMINGETIVVEPDLFSKRFLVIDFAQHICGILCKFTLIKAFCPVITRGLFRRYS